MSNTVKESVAANASRKRNEPEWDRPVSMGAACKLALVERACRQLQNLC